MAERVYTFSGLAEAGLIASKLSRHDMQSYDKEDTSPLYFSPERSIYTAKFLVIDDFKFSTI